MSDVGLSVREAARRIGCDPSRVRKLLKAGKLRGYRDGRRIRVRESSVVAYQELAPIEAETSDSAQPWPPQLRPDRQRQRAALAFLQRLGVRSTR